MSVVEEPFVWEDVTGVEGTSGESDSGGDEEGLGISVGDFPVGGGVGAVSDGIFAGV